MAVAQLSAVQGDLTRQAVDVVVNAASNRMRGGGGVDGAIHRAGGPEILRDCIARFPTGLVTGDAGWTTAGDLPARWVVHTVGPNHRAGERDRSRLESCYRRSLEVADELGARTVAFPLISAGIFGWPLNDAIDAAVGTIAASDTTVEIVTIVALDDDVHRRVHAQVLRRCPPPVDPGSVGALFDVAPHQWGLRSDPYLWRDLRARLAHTPLPSDPAGLRSLILATAEEATGAPLTDAAQALTVPSYSPGHGMSAGLVHPEWWLSTAVPFLLERAVAARDERG